MPTASTVREAPFHNCVRIMLNLHALSVKGEGNSPAAAESCDDMECYWDSMTPEEQDLVGGLSEDLYTIEDGGAKQLAMTPEEKRNWAEEARQVFDAFQRREYQRTLVFLRQPSPAGLPRHCVPFLQAQCWERLGEIEAAIVFMKEAERFDSGLAVSVLLLLQRTGRDEEITSYANRVVGSRFAELLAAG